MATQPKPLPPKNATSRTPRRDDPDAQSRESVVDAIRQGILANHLVPGQRLVEAELCELLGASRGNVRAALMDLVHEGLVEHIANRGARVRIVGLQEALQIVQVRLAIETLCVMQAAEKITDEDIAVLREIAEQMKAVAEQGDGAPFAEYTNRAFQTYMRIAEQPVAEEILARLRARNTRHRFHLTYRPGRGKIAIPFWLATIDAICRRDPQGAQLALKRHSENVQEAMRALEHEAAPRGPSLWR